MYKKNNEVNDKYVIDTVTVIYLMLNYINHY